MAVEDFFTAELGLAKDLGDEYRYNCPFCSPNNDYKLYLHIGDKTVNGQPMYGRWHCFKCGAKGNPPSFVMQLYGMSYKEAIAELEAYDYSPDKQWVSPESLGLTDEEYLFLALKNELQPKEKPKIDYVPPPLPAGYKRLVDNFYNPEAYPFLLYAHSRGFSIQDIMTHNIGYITHSVVVLPSGKDLVLTNHLVFLTHDDQGQYIYWNTRAIGDSFVKSINAPSTELEYSKKSVVFNLNLAKFTHKVVINEGVPDALTIGASGVATFGKQVTDEQIELIVNSIAEDDEIYILLDNDAKNEIITLAEKLYTLHRNTFIVINPTGKDANSIGHDAMWDIIKNNSVRADGEGVLKFMLFMSQ